MEFNINETKIISYPNIQFNQEYRVDKQGNIWSPYHGWHKATPSKIQKGYLRVNLRTSLGSKFFMVHRLVLSTFSPCSNLEKMQVNHIDGNKENNCLENLEWCSQSENIQHSVKIGLRDNMPKGENASCNTLTEQQVLEICEELMNPNRDSYSKIGERYGVTKHAIYDIKRKKSWSWLTKNYNFI